MLDLSPWNQWNGDGTPRPGTQEIVVTLERVIARNGNHPGACHYYIHTVEASLTPERALPCAERLPKLMPGAGHLVHMPAHVYMRLGRYADAVRANEHAAHTDETYFEGRRPSGIYPIYYIHNLHFLWAAAMMEGRSAEAIGAARRVAKQVPVEMARNLPAAEAFVPTPLLALARFGRWAEILNEPAPPADLRFATAMWHYARGLALAETGRTAEAGASLDSLTAIAEKFPADRPAGNNPQRALLTLADDVLAATLASQKGAHDDAIAHYKAAVRAQDGLVYDEPPPWYFPVREALGNELLRTGEPAAAEQVFQDDLRRNPNSGWSLYGLAKALRAQGKTKQASEAERRWKEAWRNADVKL
jgi:tetratricopeptide (TPR) repeat protein